MFLIYYTEDTGTQFLMRDGEYSTPQPEIRHLVYKSGKWKGQPMFLKRDQTLQKWILDNAYRLALRTNNKILAINTGECLNEFSSCRGDWRTSNFRDIELFIWHPQTIELLTNRSFK